MSTRPLPSSHVPSRRLRAALTGAVAGVLALPLAATAVGVTPDTEQLSGELVLVVSDERPRAADEASHRHDASRTLAFVRTADSRLHEIDADAVEGLEPDTEVVATVAATTGSEPAAVERITVTARPDAGDAALLAGPGDEAAPAAIAPHQVFVVLATPAGLTPDPAMDAAAASRLVANASRFWSTQSDGKVSFTVASTTPHYVSRYSCADVDEMWSEAEARTPGFTGAPGQHLALFVPPAAAEVEGCSYGWGTIGSRSLGADNGGRIYIPDISSSLTAHEFGHNLSLHHANVFPDPSGEELTTDGVWEYGDLADVMGSSFPDEYWDGITPGNLSTVQQARLGFLPTAHQTTLSQSGSYSRTLAARDRTVAASADTPRLLTVTDPRNGVRYHVEYRSQVGLDDDAWFAMDPSVRIMRTTPENGTALVDTHPGTAVYDAEWGFWDSPWDEPLYVGETWTSLGGGVTVTMKGATAASATISVDVVGASPTAPGAPTAVTAKAGDRSATVAWAAPAANGSPITTYTVTASPGGRSATTTGATHAVVTGLTNGTPYRFTVTATNAAGTSPASSPTTAVTPVAPAPQSSVSFPDVPVDGQFHTAILWLVGREITTGYVDGTFKPTAPVSRQAMAAFLYRVAGEPDVVPTTATFRDVPADSPFRTAISWLVSQEITTGYADGTFKPTAPVSRQAMAAFLTRFAGGPQAEPTTVTFGDVPADSQFRTAISWLVSQEITTGYADGTFRPTAPVTRQAMAAFLYRFDAKGLTPAS